MSTLIPEQKSAQKFDNTPELEKATPELAPKDTFRILILDNIEHVNQLKEACKNAGHSVVPAHTVGEAMAFLDSTNHADVIICAAYLEDENIFQFLRRLRANPIHNKSMFMILALAPGPTGVKMNANVKISGQQLGADAFISMPIFDAVQLIAEIKKLLPAVPLSAQGKREAEQDQTSTMADDNPLLEPATVPLAMKDTFRILIMDTLAHTDQLKAACKDAGHTVVAAHSIKEAFAFLDGTDHADVIVCAAYLEDESVFEFLKRLRSGPIHKEAMFMTLALAPGPMGIKLNDSTEKAGRYLGADVFLNMPEFDGDLLIAEIKKVLPLVPKLERHRLEDLDARAWDKKLGDERPNSL